MPDAPDDFDYSNVVEFISNADQSELAARLYSPALYARKGQVLFLTDFSRGFSGMYNTIDNASGEVRLIARHYSQSGLSAQIRNKNTNWNYGYISNALPLIVARYYTMDVRYEAYGTGSKARFTMSVAIDGKLNTIRVRHTYSPTKIELATTDNDNYDITSLADNPLSLSERNHVSITFDMQDRVYKELYLSGASFNIANIPVNAYDDGIAEEISFAIEAEGDGTNYAYLVVHSIVISASDS